MTKPGAVTRPRISDPSLAEFWDELQTIRTEKHAVALLFSRGGNQLAAVSRAPAQIAGVGDAVLKTWRKIEPLERLPDVELPALAITVRFNSARWDSRLFRTRMTDVLRSFCRGHHALPVEEQTFQLRWHRLNTAKTVDTAKQWMKASPRVARKRPARAIDKHRESPLDAVESTAELAHVMADLERIKQPLRVRLQRVLDGLAEQVLDSPELNAQVVKQINALRTALGVGLRFKDTQEPIYLRCVVTSGAKTATIQAVSANQKRTNLAASAEYPALEIFDLGTDPQMTQDGNLNARK